jgi:hypothetical protein
MLQGVVACKTRRWTSRFGETQKNSMPTTLKNAVIEKMTTG